jgi:isopentenyl diphosphate isomerase/L-lactate dehydrogenase-like FMN-dependent dehydrogenase
MKAKTKPKRRSTKLPEFALRAQRAFKRVAKKVRAEHRAFNVPLIVWENGKVVKKRA